MNTDKNTDHITRRIQEVRAQYARTLTLLEARQRRVREAREYAKALDYQIAALEGARERQRQESEVRARQRADDATIAMLACDVALNRAIQRGIK